MKYSPFANFGLTILEAGNILWQQGEDGEGEQAQKQQNELV